MFFFNRLSEELYVVTSPVATKLPTFKFVGNFKYTLAPPLTDTAALVFAAVASWTYILRAVPHCAVVMFTVPLNAVPFIFLAVANLLELATLSEIYAKVDQPFQPPVLILCLIYILLFVPWKIQCKLPPKTKRFCPLVLK